MHELVKSVLFFCGLTALIWLFSVPIWQYPDEQAHFAEVQNLAEVKQTPIGNDLSLEIYESERLLGTLRDDFGHNRYTNDRSYRLPLSPSLYGYNEEYLASLDPASRTRFIKREAANYPPLYYVVGAFAYQQVHTSSLFTRVFVVRLVSVLLWLALLVVGYRFSRELFTNRYVRLAFVLALGLHPMLMFVGSGVNNDILMDLVGALLITQSIIILKRPLITRDLFRLGLFMVMGITTKQLVYPLLPAVFIAVMISLVCHYPGKKITFGVIGAGLAALAVYAGLRLINQGFWLPFWPSVQASPLTWLTTIKTILLQTYRQTIPWYWGVYRWLDLVLPLWTLRVIKTMMVISVIGIGYALWRQRHQWSIKRLLPWLWMGLANLIYFGGLIGWEAGMMIQHGFGHGLQGRYFFPLILTQVAFLIAGWWQLTKVKMSAKPFAALVGILFLGLNLFSLSRLVGEYYHLNPLMRFVIEFGQYKPLIAKWPNQILWLTAWLVGLIVVIHRFFNNGKEETSV